LRTIRRISWVLCRLDTSEIPERRNSPVRGADSAVRKHLLGRIQLQQGLSGGTQSLPATTTNSSRNGVVSERIN
jgi:hypothetical protein